MVFWQRDLGIRKGRFRLRPSPRLSDNRRECYRADNNWGHTHRGAEMVCVLKGAFVDGDHTYRPGDFAYSDSDIEHRPEVTGDGECVCLFAAQGALIPRDWVGRVFQPFVRI